MEATKTARRGSGHAMRRGDEDATSEATRTVVAQRVEDDDGEQRTGFGELVRYATRVAWMHARDNGGVGFRWGDMTIAVRTEDDRRNCDVGG